MNYTLNQLNIFLKVVQTKSVTKASEELHLTQPAVSIQLKNFQDQFDVILVNDKLDEAVAEAQALFDKLTK